jgi:hypothetical protein
MTYASYTYYKTSSLAEKTGGKNWGETGTF